MINRTCIFFSIVCLLGSCSGKTSDVIKTISPKGAPTLAYFDQGKNENFITSGTPTNVLAELQKNEYDFVIFDSITGLKSIKKNNANFKLAKIITGGNFYLVSINKVPDESGNVPLPGENDKVISFGQNLIPDVVYSKLCADYWHISNKANYVNGVEDALAVLVSGKYSGGNADYVFISEPALTNALNNKEATTYGKINIVKNIQQEWKNYSGQDGLAQAGLFVNNESYSKKKDELEKYVVSLNERIDIAINEPEKAIEALNQFGDNKAQQSKFGFTSNHVSLLQSNKQNRFGLVPSSKSIDVNQFLTSLGQETFSEEYFINL